MIVINCIYSVNNEGYNMTDTVMNFRVPQELKDAFEIAAKSEDMTSSQLIRRLMRLTVENYMRQNAQQGLWNEKKGTGNTKTPTKGKKRA